jgi:DNA-binding transcriptional ArsR family regulator
MASGIDPTTDAGLDRAGRVFAALADPTRRDIVRELSIDGPLTATELATRVGVSRQAAAKHLAELALIELAAGERSGREHRFSLRTAPFAEAEAWMRAIGATWDQRLQAFRELVEDG